MCFVVVYSDLLYAQAMSEKLGKSQMLQVNFRMPSGLKDKLQEVADKSGRSLTQEVNMRLLDSFSAVRLPIELRARLKKHADSNGWDTDREIANRLEESFQTPEAEQSQGEQMQLVRDEIRLMQDFMREMFELAGADPATLEGTELYRRAGELDERQRQLDPTVGKGRSAKKRGK